MARVDEYREAIKRLLREYEQYPPATGEVELETIFDEKQDRYQLAALGWQGKRRVHGCLIHLDLKGDKVWLQHSSTDSDIARELVERGVPADHIVLGFQPERHRRVNEPNSGAGDPYPRPLDGAARSRGDPRRERLRQ